YGRTAPPGRTRCRAGRAARARPARPPPRTVGGTAGAPGRPRPGPPPPARPPGRGPAGHRPRPAPAPAPPASTAARAPPPGPSRRRGPDTPRGAPRFGSRGLPEQGGRTEREHRPAVKDLLHLVRLHGATEAKLQRAAPGVRHQVAAEVAGCLLQNRQEPQTK